MENENNKTFRYSYSAAQQEEVRQIRRKYLAEEEDKMAQLRRLDAEAHRKGQVVSMVLGIVGCLVMGAGMSCVMVLGGVWFAPGIAVGVVGLLAVAAAYPVYARITKKERERLAPEILRLTDELMK